MKKVGLASRASVCLGLVAFLFLSSTIAMIPVEAKTDQLQAPDPVIREMLWKVTTSKMYSTIYDLQNFSTRYTHSQNISKAAQYIRDRFNASGLVTEFQELTVGSSKVNNVIGTLKGSNTSSNVTYVLGAHYDSTSGDSDPMLLAPGADDDGSGTAGVILAADAMSKYKFRRI
jgi:acetylornithine deacetylase/succinyl-diaminopimelate desuccinylase-like protein